MTRAIKYHMAILLEKRKYGYRFSSIFPAPTAVWQVARYRVDPLRTAALGPRHGVQDIVRQQIWQLHVLRHDPPLSPADLKDLHRASGLRAYGKIAAAPHAEIDQR